MKILVNTSTFKQDSIDESPNFINSLIENFDKKNDYYIMFPRKSKKVKTKTYSENIYLLPYHYFIPIKFSNLSEIGLLEAIRLKKRNLIKIIFLLISQILHLIYYQIKIKPDYVYSHWLFPQAFLSALALKFFKVKLVFTCHGSDISILNSFGLLGNSIINFVLKNTYKFTTVSSLTKNYLFKNQKIIQELLPNKIIPMGIEDIFFEKNIIEETNDEKLNILIFGRLSYYKGADLVIEAAKLLHKNHSNLHFNIKIVGNGILSIHLKNLIKKYSLQNYIQVETFQQRKELIELIDQSNLVIIPSRVTKNEFEAGPLSFIEALSRKKICIISSSIGFVEYATVKNSIIFESDNVKDLYKKILDFTELSIEKKDLIKKSAYEMSKKFKFNKIANKTENFLFDN